MSDIDLVVKSSKHIESALVRIFGATGKGLHEKVSSVEKMLAASLVKRIRYIASIRNKIIHDDGYRKIDDRASFKAAVKLVKKELKKLEKSSGLKWKVIFVILVLITLVSAAAYFFEWLEW